MVWGVFRETHLGRFTDKVVQKSVPMQRGARFAFSRSAPMQGGVHVGSSQGVRNVIKPMFFC